MTDDRTKKGIQDRTRINPTRTTNFATGPKSLELRRIN
jgi:hypothetical protein